MTQKEKQLLKTAKQALSAIEDQCNDLALNGTPEEFNEFYMPKMNCMSKYDQAIEAAHKPLRDYTFETYAENPRSKYDLVGIEYFEQRFERGLGK